MRCHSVFMLARVLLLFAVIIGTTACTSVVADDNPMVKRLHQGGTVLMIRHALAPGIGDPDEFDVEDCKTQRNLNDEGREQARAIGQWLRARGVEDVRVYSSEWCRCLETARLMDIGKVEPLMALNSFFELPEDRGPNLADLQMFLMRQDLNGPLIVFVTHQATIGAVTGVYPASGHGVVLE